MTQTELRGRLNGAQRTRLGSLLNMMYRPSELAEVVGFAVRQVYRVYVPLGCPHDRDEKGHIWVNGAVFREWYQAVYVKTPLAEDEAYCLTCRRAVKIVDGDERQLDWLVYIVSECPVCGRVLSRILCQERA